MAKKQFTYSEILITAYLVGGNSAVNSILALFSERSITDSVLGEHDWSWAVFTLEALAAGNLFLVTAAAYDGSVHDIANILTPDRGNWKSKTLGIFSGLIKGITGFVATYLLLQKSFGSEAQDSKDNEFNGGLVAAAVFLAIPYCLMETVKITSKLDTFVDSWDETLKEYQDLSPLQKLSILGHIICTVFPAMITLSALMLSFNKYSNAQFWTTLSFAFVIATIASIGPTNQYCIKWTGAEGREKTKTTPRKSGIDLNDISEETAQLLLADHNDENHQEPPHSPRSLTVARGMATAGTSVKFLLSVFTLLVTGVFFSNEAIFRENLNLQHLHTISEHEFDTTKVWVPTLILAALAGFGYFNVQLPRLQKKAEEHLAPLLAKFGQCGSSHQTLSEDNRISNFTFDNDTPQKTKNLTADNGAYSI